MKTTPRKISRRRLRFEELEDRRLLANLAVLSVTTDPEVPIAGEPFAVRVDFRHEAATGTPYAIGWSINERPEYISPPITLGDGGNWIQVRCCWILHSAGTYDITVRLDAGNTIAETNESDNSLTHSVTVGGTVTEEWDLVKAREGLELLGDGTDVIVGTMDDAFDFQHPWFQGSDSLGRPRLVAALQNSLGPDGSPVNAGHATSVMGVVLARGRNEGDLIGLAPDARYVTAEFLNRAQIPGHSVSHVLDAAGFLVENGAEVINMSWSWWSGTTDESERGETSTTSLLVDYLAYARNIVAVPAVNQIGVNDRPLAPGSSRNVITVGGLDASLQRVWADQDFGPTPDGRSKPDLLGNAAAGAVTTSENWRNGSLIKSGAGGTSMSAPFVTGAAAQMLDYGKRTGQSTDHRVIKSIIMNSGVKTLDIDGSAWSHSITQPLDDQQGTGILNLVRVHEMYAAGRQPPGLVNTRGYDFSTVEGVAVESDPNSGGRQIYRLGSLPAEATIDITLAWDRHTFWDDRNSNGRIDSADTFYVSPNDAQDNLDLILFRDGVAVARSQSLVDTVEHIHASGLASGDYELHVVRRDVTNSGSGEEYAVSWHVDLSQVPGYTIAASAGGLVVDESGATDTFTVVLDRQPLTDVVISVTSNDTDEVTVSRGSLTFTPANWDTPQTVVVAGADDLIVDGNQTTTITLSIDDPESDDLFDSLPDQTLSVITNDDDVPGLVVTIVSDSISENGGTTTATVTRSTNSASALTVTLASSDSSVATVPATVTIPAGQITSTPFTIAGVNDVLADGTQTVTVSATANGFVPGADSLNVTDDDIAGLTVTIADASIAENGGATTATVSRNSSPVITLTVMLTSSDTSAALVPATVTIPLGQFTSAPFAIHAVDDSNLDGTQVVFITGTAAGHTDGHGSLSITDDDAASLTLTIVDDSIAENGGTTTATVRRNADTTNELTVTLTSSDTTEATVPASVTIAAGQVASAPFAIDAVDDDLLDGLQTVTITASAASYVAGTDTVVVRHVNHAPVLTPVAPRLGEIHEGQSFEFTIDRFASGIDERDFGDSVGGIAIIGADGIGAWYAAIDGQAFVELLNLSEVSAMLLPPDARVRFVSTGDNRGVASLTYRAWDATSGMPGDRADARVHGGISAFSTATDTASLTVANLNDAPTSIALSNLSVLEDSPGAVIGNVSVTDPDVGDTHTFTLSDDRFEVVDAELRLKAGMTLDHESEPTIAISLTATDNGSPALGWTENFVITVADVNEFAPALVNTTLSVAENAPHGTLVGVLSAHDADTSQTLHFGLVGSNVFALDSITGELRIADATQLDHETTDQIVIAVSVTDSGTPPRTTTTDVTIRVNDENEFTPVVSSMNLSIPESSMNDTVIGRVVASDGDTSQVLSYTIAAGDAAGAFSISPSTGELRVADSSELDFETERHRFLQVLVTDSGSPPRSAAATILVSLQDVNEPPQVHVPLVNQSVSANVLFEWALPVDAFVDPDVGESLRHTAQLADGSPKPNWLSFDSSRLRFSGAAADADVGEIAILITASDRGTPALTASQAFQLTITANPYPWQYAPEPRDVNRDGRIAPVDALIVINELNSPQLARTGSRLPLPYDPSEHPFDVNGDGFVTAVDALVVINFLNQPAATLTEGESAQCPECGQGPERASKASRRDTKLASMPEPAAASQPQLGAISGMPLRTFTVATNRSRSNDELEGSLLNDLAFDVFMNASRQRGAAWRRSQ